MNRARVSVRVKGRVIPLGSALLEVIVALTVLGIAGISLLELALQSEHAAIQARERTATILAANAFLESVALWPREDLDRHLGRHSEGRFQMIVERPTPTLYHIVLAMPVGQGEVDRALLATSLFRELP